MATVRAAARALRRRWWLLVAVLLCSGCERGPDEAEKRAVLAGYRALAHATYDDAVGAAQELLQAVDTLNAEPSPQTLSAAREAWRRARIPYSQSEALRFGNWFVDDWDAKVNAWPVDEGFIDYVDANYVASASNPWARANLISADALRVGGRTVPVATIISRQLEMLQLVSEVETVVATGYHALEFMLWGQDRNGHAPGAGQRPWTDFAADAQRCSNGASRAGSATPCRKRQQFLQGVALLLVERLQEMRQHWAAQSSYGAALAGGDVDAGLARMLFGMATLSAEELAGERIQTALLSHAPEEEQDCFSDDTHHSLWYNALGVENLYRGRYLGRSGDVLQVPALATLVQRHWPTLAGRLEQAFARSREALARVRERGEAGERFDQLIAPDNAAGEALLREAIAALQAQSVLLQALAEALELGALNPAAPADSENTVAGAEPGEAFPAGTATLTKLNPDVDLERHAYSQPVSNLAPARRGLFAVGNGFFSNPWVAAPASTPARDGLGPLFNAASCQDCHIRDGRGRPPREGETGATSAVVRIGLVGGGADPVYGSQIQDRALPGIAPEAQIQVRWHPHRAVLADGDVIALRAPTVVLAEPAYGALAPQARLALRVAPPMIGLGLLEAIPAPAIVAGEDVDDSDGDGISGRANRVPDLASGRGELGRFGWKATQPSVRQQSLSAFANDIGISSVLFPAEICTTAQPVCTPQYAGGTPELGADIENAVVFYARHLAVPARRWHAAPEVLAGKQLFHRLGCASCHRPHWTTAEVSGAPELSQQRIWPYTDLLLHDMGEGLADGIAEFQAGGREWRTPPLWGIHLAKAVGGAGIGFLHDGRARDFKEAILWHGGEAQAARDAWAALPREQREQLVWFLKSL